MNYNDIRNYETLVRLAALLGFKVCASKHFYEQVTLTPHGEYKNLDATLPVFSRDAEFGYGGTVESTTAFLMGWERATAYYRALFPRTITSDKIKEKELALNKHWKHLEELAEQQKTIDILKGEKVEQEEC